MKTPKSVRLVVLGKPRSGKNSQRILQAGARRFVLKSKAAGAWLLLAREAYQKQYRGPKLQGALAIHIDIYQSHHVPDGDNVQALVWDSLKGQVISDDGQFVQWSGAKHVGEKPYRVEILVTEAA